MILGIVGGSFGAIAMAERGVSGHLKILFWQAPSLMNPYLSNGSKDVEASTLVLEPLARYDQDGVLLPWLAKTIPTVANGGVSADFTSITWTLREELLWSDGTPVTTADILFTYDYCTHPDSGCARVEDFESIATIKAIDKQTVIINFSKPKPFPYVAFVGSSTPLLQKNQFLACLGEQNLGCSEQNFAPIGTGPFVVTEFRPNDVALLAANENYRYSNKPGFARVTLKGGGDAMAAGRAVLVTGEFDYAWNLQLPPNLLAQMEAQGQGRVISSFGSSVERIEVNLTNPAPALGEERSTITYPHPFLNEIAVRKALSLVIDRNILNEIGYGTTGKPTCNFLVAPSYFASTNNDTCLVQNIDGANNLLDNAGWLRDTDGVRSKDGIRLSILFQTSTNSVRQNFQALLKHWWEEIGIETELRNIDASVYFGGDPGNPDTYLKFYADLQMYTSSIDGTDPEPTLANWKCGHEPSPKTQWLGVNIPRYCDPAYDALFSALASTSEFDQRVELAKAMNDKLVQEYILIPLIHRGSVAAHANTLEGVILNTWDAELWNIADWTRIQ